MKVYTTEEVDELFETLERRFETLECRIEQLVSRVDTLEDEQPDVSILDKDGGVAERFKEVANRAY